MSHHGTAVESQCRCENIRNGWQSPKFKEYSDVECCPPTHWYCTGHVLGNHSDFCSLLLRLNHAWWDASGRNMAGIWNTANLKGNRESGCPERGLKIVQWQVTGTQKGSEGYPKQYKGDQEETKLISRGIQRFKLISN